MAKKKVKKKTAKKVTKKTRKKVKAKTAKKVTKKTRKKVKAKTVPAQNNTVSPDHLPVPQETLPTEPVVGEDFEDGSGLDDPFEGVNDIDEDESGEGYF
jgi:hypothetical protein